MSKSQINQNNFLFFDKAVCKNSIFISKKVSQMFSLFRKLPNFE